MYCFFKKWANPGVFFIYFSLFRHTLQFLQQINVKKCPSSIHCQDSNSPPLEHESSPIDQGSRPFSSFCYLQFLLFGPNPKNTKNWNKLFSRQKGMSISHSLIHPSVDEAKSFSMFKTNRHFKLQGSNRVQKMFLKF